MSLEAMVWALKHAPVEDPLSHLVLIGLADHAGGDGTAARPSAATLAAYARCSVRTVRYRLNGLEAAGLIVRGDQQIVAHLRRDRRPVVWDLCLDRVQPVHAVQEVHPVTPDDVQEVHPVADDGVHGQVARGAQPGMDGVHAGAHKPSLNHPEPSVEHMSPAATSAGHDDPSAFDAFWQAYPRRTGRAAAAKAFAKACRSEDWSLIVAAAARLAADPNLPPVQFIPHPATWLNQERWNDPAYPPRADGRPTTADRVGDALSLAERMAADEAGHRAIGGGR